MLSRWNRLGDFSGDCKDTSRCSLTRELWDWFVAAIDDVFHYNNSPVDDVEVYIRDGDELIEVWQVELRDVHYNDGSITRRVILRPNKKCKRKKYVQK